MGTFLANSNLLQRPEVEPSTYLLNQHQFSHNIFQPQAQSPNHQANPDLGPQMASQEEEVPPKQEGRLSARLRQIEEQNKLINSAPNSNQLKNLVRNTVLNMSDQQLKMPAQQQKMQKAGIYQPSPARSNATMNAHSNWSNSGLNKGMEELA